MMTTVALAIAIFTMAAILLAIGVILGKRTPLKGSCNGPAGSDPDSTGTGAGACESCTCGRPADPGEKRD